MYAQPCSSSQPTSPTHPIPRTPNPCPRPNQPPCPSPLPAPPRHSPLAPPCPWPLPPRDGHGLDHQGLQQLVSSCASLTAAEVAFARSVLDRAATGRVTLAQLMEGLDSVQFVATSTATSAAAAAAAGMRSSAGGAGLAPPVTVTLLRVEARALDVLHRAAQALARDYRLMWLLARKADPYG